MIVVVELVTVRMSESTNLAAYGMRKAWIMRHMPTLPDDDGIVAVDADWIFTAAVCQSFCGLDIVEGFALRGGETAAGHCFLVYMFKVST